MKKSWFVAVAAMALTVAAFNTMSFPAFAVESTLPETSEAETIREEGSSSEENSSEESLSEPSFEDLINMFANSDGELVAESDTSESKAETGSDYYEDSYYDTEGNASLIESQNIIYNSDEMQFISVTTKDGNVFYILIDYGAAAENGGENVVYFLNKVDDYDLYSLLYEDDENSGSSYEAYENSVNRNGSGSDAASSTDTTETATTTSSTETVSAASTNHTGNSSMLIIVGILVVLGAGGALYFFKFRKKKSSSNADADDDFEEYDDEE